MKSSASEPGLSYLQFCHKRNWILGPVFNNKSYCIFYITCNTSASYRENVLRLTQGFQTTIVKVASRKIITKNNQAVHRCKYFLRQDLHKKSRGLSFFSGFRSRSSNRFVLEIRHFVFILMSRKTGAEVTLHDAVHDIESKCYFERNGVNQFKFVRAV